MAKQATRVDPRTLKVPGATLYLEVRGSGPVLLCISGGPTDAGVFADLAERLGIPVTHLPGGHGGWGSDPQEFAERLHEALHGAR